MFWYCTSFLFQKLIIFSIVVCSFHSDEIVKRDVFAHLNVRVFPCKTFFIRETPFLFDISQVVNEWKRRMKIIGNEV